VVEFVGEALVTVAVAKSGAVVSRVTELESTLVEMFPAASFSQTLRTFAFSVEETVKLEGKVAVVYEQCATLVSFSRIQ
jgi:hypothetical protein